MDEDVRWLDDREFAAWHALIRTVYGLPEALDRQLKRDARLPHTEYVILAMLSEAEDRTLSMSRLAWTVRFSASRLSRIVAKLEERGQVVRRKDPANGRVTLATLTDTGFAVLGAAAPGHVRQVREVVFDRLAPEQVTQLRDILSAVLAGPEMRPHCPEGAGAPAPARQEGTRTTARPAGR